MSVFPGSRNKLSPNVSHVTFSIMYKNLREALIWISEGFIVINYRNLFWHFRQRELFFGEILWSYHVSLKPFEHLYKDWIYDKCEIKKKLTVLDWARVHKIILIFGNHPCWFLNFRHFRPFLFYKFAKTLIHNFDSNLKSFLYPNLRDIHEALFLSF